MPTVADCLKQHAPQYLAKFGRRVPLGHRKVISAITRCRTGLLGGTHFACQSCGRTHWVGRSCGNRHCPTCQIDKTAKWFAKQRQRMLPVHHFMVTFTVPEAVRRVLRANQREGYAAIFDCGSATIRGMLANPKFLGSRNVGFFGVLHTWGRDPMVYHPHVHFVVPGGGVSNDGTKWLATPKNFLFHHGSAIKVYREKFKAAMKCALLYDKIPSHVWKQKWVVDIKPVGDGKAVLKYLAPYVYRVAISDNRIERCSAEGVTFRYTPSRRDTPSRRGTPSGTKRTKRRTVTGEEFTRGFLQHVLPSGFQKVRHYGWMSQNSRTSRAMVWWLVWLHLGWTYWLGSGLAPQTPEPKRTIRCAACGGKLRVVRHVHFGISHALRRPRCLAEQSVPYLDTG